ncbi:MAG: ABC transporter permease [Micrococcaceae bacterium]
MGRFILRRVLQMIPVFFGATFLVYYLVFSMPGDPIQALFGDKPVADSVKQAFTQQFHLDQPFLVQYFIFIKNLLTFNLGTDFSGVPISETLAQAFPVTARLAFMALAFEAFFGIIFGLYAGLKKGGWFDGTVLFISLLVISVPTFVLGFVMQLVFGVNLHWARPTVGSHAGFSDLVLPAIVLGLVSFGYVLRLTRTSVIENANADYVRTATAKGLPRKQVISRHILRNSLIPVVTYLGADLGALMGGAIVTESIFNVPGVGNALYKAINAGEAPTVVIIVSVLVMVFLLTNLLVDLLYAWLDPRIRYE